MTKREFPDFTSRLGNVPTLLVLLWLPMHVFGLPALLYKGFQITDDIQLNFLTYVIGSAFLLLVGFRFLRREFDMLAEQPGRIFLQILGCYGAMLLMNMAVSGLVALFVDAAENPNNAAVMDMVDVQHGKMSAIAVFLAPFVEEMMFRAGVFGLIRRKSRVLAYVVTIALFSLYHIWGYALNDPMSWFYLLQYLPASYLLCRCYEYCNCIWGSLFFHMLTNFVSLQALSALEGLL